MGGGYGMRGEEGRLDVGGEKRRGEAIKSSERKGEDGRGE